MLLETSIVFLHKQQMTASNGVLNTAADSDSFPFARIDFSPGVSHKAFQRTMYSQTRSAYHQEVPRT